MSTLYDVAAPAKLNLFLHVVGRRADGYHLLQSVFALIDWCDTLHFDHRADGAISREDLGDPLPPEDLILKAARALQQACGATQGVHVAVRKCIPAQAGMGGGSSDAASTLLALNRLWGLKLPLSDLMRIGLSLGADVPFFLSGRNAWVEGIGDHIRPIRLAPRPYLVVKPPQGISTAALFRHPALKRNTDPATMDSFAADPLGFGRNDLEPVARMLCPGVSEAIEWLESHGLHGRMTGSGSAVFAPSDAVRDLTGLPEGFLQRWCRGLEVHPLAGWASSDELPVVGASR